MPSFTSGSFDQMRATLAIPLPTANSIVVAKDGSSSLTTIAQAIQRAGPGSVVFVKPGNYTENLEIRTSVSIIGIGDRSRVVIRSSTSWTIDIDNGAKVELYNLSIHSDADRLGTSALNLGDCKEVIATGCDFFCCPGMREPRQRCAAVFRCWLPPDGR